MVNYPVGDFLIRIKNAAMAGNNSIEVESTKLIVAVAEVLKREGFLSEIKKSKDKLKVQIAFKSKRPVLMDIKLVSKLGLRIYKNVDEIKQKRGASIYVISTPAGVLSSKEAIKKNVGGEVIAEVY